MSHAEKCPVCEETWDQKLETFSREWKREIARCNADEYIEKLDEAYRLTKENNLEFYK